MATPVPTQRQVSAGGVVYRRIHTGTEIALVLVRGNTVRSHTMRWQLPKGIVEPDESPEVAALREAREEAGVEAELVAPLETVEYWYYGRTPHGRVRYHKFVHFFLLEYRAGDVRDHDREVEEARWVPISEAVELLAFEGERKVARAAAVLLAGGTQRSGGT